MKKYFLISLLLSAGLLYNSTVTALSSCAMCSSANSWTLQSDGSYQCNWGGGSDGSGLGVTCNLWKYKISGKMTTIGYQLSGMNDGLSVNHLDSSVSFSASFCAARFEAYAVVKLSLCPYAPQYWILEKNAGYYNNGNHCGLMFRPHHGTLASLTMNDITCPTQRYRASQAICSICYYEIYPNS